MSPGSKTHFANNGKIIYLRKTCWFDRIGNITYPIPQKSRYVRYQALELLCNSLCGPLPKICRALIYMNWIDVTDVSTRVSLFGTAGCRWTVYFLRTKWYSMRGSSQQGRLQPAYDRFSNACDQAGGKSALKRLRYCVFQDAQGGAFCKWAEINCSRWRRSSTWWYSRVTVVGTKRLIHVLVKQTQFCVSFIAPWWRNGSFQRPQSFQFLNGSLFRSSPVNMNLRWRLKEYCQKNKQQRRDNCLRVLSVSLRDKEHMSEIRKARWCQATSPNREIPPMLVRPCVQNVSEKNGELSPSGCSQYPRESSPEVVHWPGGVTTSPTLLGPVLVWSEQNYLRLLLIVRYFGSSLGYFSRDSPQGRAGTKMSEWMSM